MKLSIELFCRLYERKSSRKLLIKKTKRTHSRLKKIDSNVNAINMKTIKRLKSIEVSCITFTSFIEFVKNYIVKREFLCHHHQPHTLYHFNTKILRNQNLIDKEQENKSDYENAYLLKNTKLRILLKNTPTTQ